MKIYTFRDYSVSFITFVLVVLLLAMGAAVNAQTTAFTYQGKLTDNGTPSSGNYDMQFKVFDTPTIGTGTQFGSTVTLTNVLVANGLFTVTIDFGAGVFDGSSRYLEISVKQTSNPTFVILGPRQQVTTTPYAVKSLNASNATTADGLSIACVNCVTSSQIQSVSGSQLTGSVAGSLISGAIPVDSLPSGSTNYIQNTTSPQTSSSFNISGNGVAAGMLSGNILNATTQYNINGSRILSAQGADNLFAGAGAGTSNTTGMRNSFFGSGAGAASTSNENSFFGYNAGVVVSNGCCNSFFGSQAGRNATTGNGNSFFGDGAGFQTTLGGQNSFFGANAGAVNTGGSSNSYFGVSAGVNTTTGNYNSFFGVAAGAGVSGDNNSIFGSASGLQTSSGNGNTFIGASAGFPDPGSSGDNNTLLGMNTKVASIISSIPLSNATIVGANASVNSAFTSNATVVGYNASVVSSGGSNVINATAIGANASVTANNATAIGANATATGSDSIVLGNGANIGIGTSAPIRPLQIVTSAQQVVDIQSSSSGGSWLNLINTNTGGRKWDFISTGSANGEGAGKLLIRDDPNNTVRMTFDTVGNVGIGTTSPLDKLQVAGNLRVGTGTNGCIRDADATVIAGSCSSDGRLKRNITPFPRILNRLAKLQPVHFYWRSEDYPNRGFGDSLSFGLIAQDVEQVLPELVVDQEDGLKAVRYNKLPLLMLQGIRELKEDNDSLKRENATLKKRLDEQDARLRRLESRMKSARAGH